MTDQAERDPALRAQTAESGRGGQSLPELPAYSVLQQQLIDARDELDREVMRLTRMQVFNAQALRMADDAEFIQSVGEAIVDIFELEFGICWRLDESGEVLQPIGVLGVQANASELRKAGARLASARTLTSDIQIEVLGQEAVADLAPALSVGQAICGYWRDSGGKAAALILGGNTLAGTSFFDTITPKLGQAFGIFAQQLAALMENRKGRATIERQMVELTQERSLQRTLIETLPDLVWLKDPEGVYLACNPRFERFFGASQEEIVGKTDYDFVDAEFGHFFRARDRAAIASAGPTVNEEWITFADDGHRELLETTKTAMFDAQHNLVGVPGIGHDLTERRRAERNLSMAVDATQLVFWELDFKSGRLTFDLNLLPVLGLAPDDELKTLSGWIAHVHPDDVGQFMNHIENVMEPGNSGFDAEYRIRTEDGQYRWIHTKGRVIQRRNDGQPELAVGTSTNITARKDIEETVRTSEEHSRNLASLLRRMCDNVPDMIWAKDMNNRFLFANRAICERLLNASDTAEPLGKNDMFFAQRERESHAENPQWHTFGELCQDSDAITLERGQPSVFEEFGNVRGKLLVLDVHKAPFFNENGEIIGTVGSARDITERKLIESELEVHRKHLEEVVQHRTSELLAIEIRASRILESTADGLYGVDNEDRIVFINPACCRMLGYTAEQVIGCQAHTLFHHRRPDGSHYSADECVTRQAWRAGQESRAGDETYWHADGHPVPVALASHPIIENGEITGAVVSVVDISDRRAAIQAREQALIAAENLARARSEFIANMSHEIRTPMNGMLGFAHIGQRNYKDPEKARNAFEMILTSGNRLLGVVNEILDFSKIDAGKLQIEAIELSIGDALDHALELVADRSRIKGLELHLEKAADLPPTCIGDPLRLGQVLLNLLTNAVKFTETGSVTVSAARQGEQLVFRVIDTGIGMTEEQLGYVFNPFQQADSSSTRRFGGTGLGLAICKRLLDLMHGEIRVESTPGRGSRFEFLLPYVKPEARATASATSLMTDVALVDKPLAGISILLAEDDEINQVVLEVNLLDDGARLVIVGDGAAAVERVVADGPMAYDIVLMDIQMPVMDGYDAARRIRAVAPDLPIIGQTAHAFSEDQEKCLAAGMVGHIAKPIDPPALAALILQVIAAKNGK